MSTLEWVVLTLATALLCAEIARDLALVRVLRKRVKTLETRVAEEQRTAKLLRRENELEAMRVDALTGVARVWRERAERAEALQAQTAEELARVHGAGRKEGKVLS